MCKVVRTYGAKASGYCGYQYIKNKKYHYLAYIPAKEIARANKNQRKSKSCICNNSYVEHLAYKGHYNTYSRHKYDIIVKIL